MMEKKVIGGNIAIALGIVCIVFVAGLAAAIASYTSIINNKDTAHQDYVSTHSHTNAEYNSLSASYQDYTGTHSHTNSEYDGYVLNHQVTNSEYNNYVVNHQVTDSEYNNYVANHHHTDQEFEAVTTPKLVTVNLKAQDLGTMMPLGGTPILHVYGYICNVGTYAAYNSKIHVVAYQADNVVAIDTYITLGTLYGETWTTVDSSFTYSGDSLTHWTMTPQWTNTP